MKTTASLTSSNHPNQALHPVSGWNSLQSLAVGKSSQFWKSATRRPQLVAALPVVIASLICAILAPVLAPYDPLEQDFANILRNPSLMHPFGTDEFGRDMLSRAIWSARLSIGISLAAVTGALLLGGITGLIAGFTGGAVDGALMRIVDAVLAFPGLILVLALAASLGPSIRSLVVGLAVAFTPTFARLSRALVLREKHRDYVTAAVSVGQRPYRIVGIHILPNLVLPLVVQFSLSLGAAMIAEASLSYLGLAARPNEPSWGRMVLHGRMVIETHPHVAVIPLIVLSVVILAFNLLGDGLSDMLDPQLRRSV